MFFLRLLYGLARTSVHLPTTTGRGHVFNDYRLFRLVRDRVTKRLASGLCTRLVRGANGLFHVVTPQTTIVAWGRCAILLLNTELSRTFRRLLYGFGVTIVVFHARGTTTFRDGSEGVMFLLCLTYRQFRVIASGANRTKVNGRRTLKLMNFGDGTRTFFRAHRATRGYILFLRLTTRGQRKTPLLTLVFKRDAMLQISVRHTYCVDTNAQTIGGCRDSIRVNGNTPRTERTTTTTFTYAMGTSYFGYRVQPPTFRTPRDSST